MPACHVANWWRVKLRMGEWFLNLFLGAWPSPLLPTCSSGKNSAFVNVAVDQIVSMILLSVGTMFVQPH